MRGATALLVLSLACRAAADPRGTRPWPEEDGSAGASTGAPQFPQFLSRYKVRPPWAVAGVDYAVGVPSAKSLKDPASLKTPGVTLRWAEHSIHVTGRGVVLAGYDFSLEGGWGLYVEGANDVIENSYFKVGTNNVVPIAGAATALNLSVLHNTIDGGGSGVAGNPGAIWSLISYNGIGLTVSYNWLKRAPQHIVEFKTGQLIEENNLINDTGFAPGAHPNDVQFCAGISENSVISYNTIYNPQPDKYGYPKMNNEDLQVEAQLGGVVLSTSVEHNVVIATGGAALTSSYLIAVRQDQGANILNGVHVRNNYLDVSGAYGPFYPPSGGHLDFTNNINLVTGAVFAPPAGANAARPGGDPAPAPRARAANALEPAAWH